MKQLDRRQGPRAVIRALRGVILDSRNLVPSTPLPAPPNYGVENAMEGKFRWLRGPATLRTCWCSPLLGSSIHRAPSQYFASKRAGAHAPRSEEHLKVRQSSVRVPYPIQERQQLCVVGNEVHCRLSARHRSTL